MKRLDRLRDVAARQRLVRGPRPTATAGVGIAHRVSQQVGGADPNAPATMF